ncbi:unnamed protein product [Arctia plantaginis]|uniref:Uncharacterized protein n=1 Tax=Arctia plantaginis TaxID=874455 RepID=A0A8S1BFC4_ARCPL|nr:unnamed protein product [Arctia plantaginis]
MACLRFPRMGASAFIKWGRAGVTKTKNACKPPRKSADSGSTGGRWGDTAVPAPKGGGPKKGGRVGPLLPGEICRLGLPGVTAAEMKAAAGAEKLGEDEGKFWGLKQKGRNPFKEARPPNSGKLLICFLTRPPQKNGVCGRAQTKRARGRKWAELRKEQRTPKAERAQNFPRGASTSGGEGGPFPTRRAQNEIELPSRAVGARAPQGRGLGLPFIRRGDGSLKGARFWVLEGRILPPPPKLKPNAAKPGAAKGPQSRSPPVPPPNRHKQLFPTKKEFSTPRLEKGKRGALNQMGI